MTNQKSRYKILNPKLGHFWKEPAGLRCFSKEHVLLGTKGKIDPIFNRNGYYYDRIKKFSWFEFAGEAYIVEDYSKLKRGEFNFFLWDLEYNEGENQRLDKDAIVAIKKLIELKLASKKQIKLIELENSAYKNSVHAKDVRYRFLKFCKDRNIKITKKIIPLP
jgi:hypothetical protein